MVPWNEIGFRVGYIQGRSLAASPRFVPLSKKLSPHWLRHAHGSHAHQRGAPAATIRDTLGHASLSTTDLYLSSAPTDGSSLYLKF